MIKQKTFQTYLAEVVAKINDPRVAADFLANILTPKELEDISLRLQIIKLLKSGLPQREIAKKLRVSIGTVSRGSREIKYGQSKFIELLK